ncbi:hypothetical protein C1Y63_04960 [Corynebacterium sp. 13CS0277]|nr:hypothetical protein C1Y63_04960 [Corynebacterium sp. 13CS0277]
MLGVIAHAEPLEPIATIPTRILLDVRLVPLARVIYAYLDAANYPHLRTVDAIAHALDHDTTEIEMGLVQLEKYGYIDSADATDALGEVE